MKPVVVEWDATAHAEYEKLRRAAAEHRPARSLPTNEQLLASIDRAIARLKKDPFCGGLIPRAYLSKKVLAKYGTQKIFRLSLVGYWRLLYTVVGDEARIIAFILEYLDHQSYDKLFGYEKK